MKSGAFAVFVEEIRCWREDFNDFSKKASPISTPKILCLMILIAVLLASSTHHRHNCTPSPVLVGCRTFQRYRVDVGTPQWLTMANGK